MEKSLKEVMEGLPLEKIEESLYEYMKPMLEVMPDKRMERVVVEMVRGILGSESPVITQMAQSIEETESGVWATAKRMYRLLKNRRIETDKMNEALREIARRSVELAPSQTSVNSVEQSKEKEEVEKVIIAIDPVNFEKAYTEELEGVSIVQKSTPPDLNGKKRLTKGYPALTAQVVNSKVPATLYAQWFSYEKAFVSENVEIQKAIDASEVCFPNRQKRYVLDAGFDDKRWFAALSKDEFVIRAYHRERLVEVYNERLKRWEPEILGDLVDVVLYTHRWRVTFTHAREVRKASLDVGFFCIRLPDTHQQLWVLVTYDLELNRTLILLTNVPLLSIDSASSVYEDWRLRSRIEHGYRLDQEQGLDVEDMRVQFLDRMQRLFLLVLLAVQFLFYLQETWDKPAILWIRLLGGKLGLRNDLDGPYLLLRGLKSLFQTARTLSVLAVFPFPFSNPLSA